MAFLVIFFLVPIANIVRESLVGADGSFTLSHYIDIMQVPTYRAALRRTITTALLVTLLCACIAFPYAYLMTLVGARGRAILLGTVLVPFWTSMLARTYAWLILLQDGGPISQVLGRIRLDAQLSGNLVGVSIGMVQILLPFMLIPLYNTMSTIDRRLMLAAHSLGADPRRAFRQVFLPLSVPGLAAGSVMVFVLALGFYVTPAVLGSPPNTMLSQLAAREVSEKLAWGSAGAMSVILAAITTAILLMSARVIRLAPGLAKEASRIG